MTQRSILVTGGAGYIGSHTVLQLRARGERVVVLDDLSTGFRDAVLDAPLIVGNAGDAALVRQVLRDHDVDTVMHFAASISVPDSVREPLAYSRNNTVNTRALLEACAAHGLEQFVFSSTAAVYGMPASGRASEVDPTQPINPYGRSKLMSEWMLRDLEAATATGTHPLRYVALRYFNVAGADPGGRIGQNSSNATHLIANACNAALKRQSEFKIFGTDFPTPDGTGIRDYIHVEDLATAHVDGLRYLEQNGESQILNCGYGKGYSVRQVVEQAKAISGVDFPVIELERRPGDPACVTACADKIRQVLNWQPKHNNLDNIIYSHLVWETRKLTDIIKPTG